MTKAIRYFGFLLLSVGVFLFFFQHLPENLWVDFRTLFLNIPKARFLLIGFIFTGVLFLVALRQFLIYRQFSCPIPYVQALSASLSGQIYGLFFLPLLSGILGQSLELKRTALPPSVTAFIVTYDRLLVAGIGGILAVGSLFYLQPSFTEHLRFLYVPVFHILVPLLAVAILVGIKFLWSKERYAFQATITFRNSLYFLGTSLCSILGWILVPGTFAIIILTFNPTLPFSMVMSACIVVSFLASLPITPNGWGIREFAAVKIFSILGIAMAPALFTSISIGLVSLIILLFVGSLLLLMCKKHHIRQELKKSFPTFKGSFLGISSKLEIDNRMVLFLTTLAAVFVFFQVRLLRVDFSINLNFADTCSLIILAIFILDYFILSKKEIKLASNTLSFFKWSTLVFFVSFLQGWYRFGFSEWAFFSKFLGWFVIVGYMVLGMMFARAGTASQLRRLIILMSTVVFSIILYQIFLYFLWKYQFLGNDYIANDYFSSAGLVGYALNRNAFCYQLLIMITLLHCQISELKEKISVWHYVALGLFYTAIFLTYSRSGIFTAGVLLSGFVILKFIKLKDLLRLVLNIMGWLALLWALDNITLENANAPFFMDRFAPRSADHFRFYTMLEGLKMWAKSPFFGEGLGGFVMQEEILNHRFVTIHNSFIWLLAECGLIGTLPFIIYSFRIVRDFYDRNFQKVRHEMLFNDKILLGLIIIFAAMSSLHEMLYQRLFWFVLGMVLIQGTKKKGASTSNEL